MAGEWTRCSVADLIRLDQLIVGDGYRAKNDELSAQGLPFARVANINDGFRFADADRFPETSLSRVGNKISEPGDVVFTSKGTVGRFAFVRPDTPRFVYSPQLCYWRVLDTTLIHPHYLYYWMYSREFFVQFKGVAGQTDMAEYVSLADQRRMHISLPDIQTTTRHRPHPRHAGRQDRAEPAHERDPGGDGPRAVQVVVRGLRPGARQGGGPRHGAAARDRRSVPGWVRGVGGGGGAGGVASWKHSRLLHKDREWRYATAERAEILATGDIPWLTSGEVRQSIVIGTDNMISEEGLAHSSAKMLAERNDGRCALRSHCRTSLPSWQERCVPNQACCGLVPAKSMRSYLYLGCVIIRGIARTPSARIGAARI